MERQMIRWICLFGILFSMRFTAILNAKTIDITSLWDEQVPLANPHKGWYHHYLDNGLRKYLVEDDEELLRFPGMDHLYLRLAWSYLEPREGEYHWQVIDPLIKKWTDRGYGIAFRISCRETGTYTEQQQYATPKWVIEAGAQGDYVYKGKRTGPTGPWEPDYDDPVYLAKLDRFLEAFAARYDGKPWLRYVDIGSIGDWGEGHTSSGSRAKYNWQQRKKHVDLHLKYFKKSLLVLSDDFVYAADDAEGRQRLHDYAVANGITYRDDSILVDWYLKTKYDTATVRSPEYFDAVYQQYPTILELQHYHMAKQTGNWMGTPGSSIAQKGEGKTGADIFREAIDHLHATYIGYHGYAREWLSDNPELTKELLNRCGYWYFIHDVTIPDVLRPGKVEKVQVTWENRGAAPAYVPFRLILRLEGEGHIQDYSLEANNRVWMPGKVFSEDYTLKFPTSFQQGSYHFKLKLYCSQTERSVGLALKESCLDEDGFYTLTAVHVGRNQ